MSLERSINSRHDLVIGLKDSVGETPEISFGLWSSGLIVIPTGSSITTLTFHAAARKGETYGQLHDEDNSAVTYTVAAGRSYPLPGELKGAGAFKIVTNADGNVELVLKS